MKGKKPEETIIIYEGNATFFNLVKKVYKAFELQDLLKAANSKKYLSPYV